MKLTPTLVALALALAGGAASAATIGTLYDPADVAQPNNPVLGPIVYSAFEHDGPANTTPTFDYVYNFQLNAVSDLDVFGNTYSGPSVAADTAVFTLYTGTSTGNSGTPGTMVGTAFSFAGQTIQNQVFHGLDAASYFFEITGSIAMPTGTAYNVTVQAPSDTNPLPSVPEPANMALLLAGLGLLGFMAKRRARD
jgi:hypothetical protein